MNNQTTSTEPKQPAVELPKKYILTLSEKAYQTLLEATELATRIDFDRADIDEIFTDVTIH
jgi:hypothetical protein